MEAIKYEEFDTNYHYFTIPYKRGETAYHLVISDVHIDNPKCNRVKLKEDLDLIKSLNGTISITGDLLDLMQGRFDRRASKRDLKKDYVEGGTYFESVIDDAVKFLSPYA